METTTRIGAQNQNGDVVSCLVCVTQGLQGLGDLVRSFSFEDVGLDPASRDRLRCQGHEARREEARLIAAIDAVNARTAVANARAAEERRLRDAALAQLDATIAGRVAQEARTAELERRVAERYGTNHTAGG